MLKNIVTRNMWWSIIALVLIPAFYILLRRPHKFWIKKGVKQGNPVLLFGDTWRNVIKKQSFAEMVQMFYDLSPDSRYVGIYHQFLLPTLVIRDPDLIKQITVKDFDHFVNHRSFIPENSDPLWGKNLFSLKDQRWKEMRATLSPAFTTSKMKYMFTLISESGEQFVEYFRNQNKDVVTVELKDTFTRFTNDVIANTAFGVKCNSLEERNNEFYLMGKEATNFSGFWKTLKFIGYFLVPWLYKIFNVTLFSKSVEKFFIKLIKDNIVRREKYGIVRPDMINLLMEARKNNLENEESEPSATESEIAKPLASAKQPITDIDITAQTLLFFFGGFDSVSSLMCFVAYELGINPAIQEMLRYEVDKVSENYKGKLTYEALMGMKYLDMVVSETLRLWPTASIADRVCTRPYVIEPKYPDEKPLHLEIDTLIWFPIFGLHRDPNYFPDPERFDPERFNAENKTNIKPYTYLPFGLGPRNCIGSRFALLETKVLFYHILSHFEIVSVEKTKIPLQLCKDSFNLLAEGGFWFGFKRRNLSI